VNAQFHNKSTISKMLHKVKLTTVV